MKVLLDLSVLSTPTLSRGMGRYVSSLAAELHRQARGAGDLRVVALPERPLFGSPPVTEDVTAAVEELAQRRQLGTRPARGGKRVLARAVEMSGADVVHTLDPQGLASTDLRVPWVVTCHHLEARRDSEGWHGTEARILKSDRKRFSACDHIIAISSATAHDLITRLDVARDKISVVHHGVALRRWSAPAIDEGVARRAALGLSKRPYLLGVGAVDQRKNVDALFDGLARARGLLGNENLVVAWAGRLDRGEQQRLRSKATRAGVADAIILLGYVSDENLRALYGGASALVFVSRKEGFGYPVVEAMAAGCPVITSNRSSLIEVARGAAITVDPDDTDAIADAIVLLADDNAERRRLGRAGQKRAADFSLKKMVEGTVSAYRRAIRH